MKVEAINMKKEKIGIVKQLLVSVWIFTLIASFSTFTLAQETVDEAVIAKIKTEGFQNSKAWEDVSYLVDVFGPRLTNSPELRKAQDWMAAKMKSYGLNNVNLEHWGTFGKGWTIERHSFEMFAPTYDRINAIPLAWSPSTKGVVSGEPVFVSIRSEADFEKYRGKLKDKIVMNGTVSEVNWDTNFESLTKRLEDKDLESSEKAIDPYKENAIGGGGPDYLEEEDDWNAGVNRRKAIIKFLKDEGIAALVEPSRNPFGVVRVQGFYEGDETKNVPAFAVSREQFARMLRLNQRQIPVKVELNLQTKISPAKEDYNIIGEITGTDPNLKDEVVLLGGHFDSWHGGTGAVDNASNCVTIMEALRILKTIGIKPRRTIRIALWSGEEQDYFGSYNYVKKHYGDAKTGELKPDHSKLSAYYNLDNGGGKIRGVFLQGNEAVRPIFEDYLKPFNYLGAKTITVSNTTGTDHMVFDAIGLPGFQFIQDPLDYNTRVHHSNMDVLEAVNPEDLKINAVIVASFAYHTAMRDEKLPREPLRKR